MSEENFVLSDFEESLGGIKREDIKTVTVGWGRSPEGCSWEGGFLMLMKDGRWCYVTGWCDTSGWGCQDGRDEFWFDHQPSYDEIVASADGWPEPPPLGEWSENPPDLNRWVAGEVPVERQG